MVIVKLWEASTPGGVTAEFTFQYGYSKTDYQELLQYCHKNLHSNMVIVKLRYYYHLKL